MSFIELLDHSGQFDAEYDTDLFTGLSNHLPMALSALKRLGADDARLAGFAHTYSLRLRPAPPAAEWPAGEPWRALLGQQHAWPAYRHLFLHWLATEEPDAVLQQTLPVLMAGCGGAAFHGLICTAYAVQSGHGQELADALAYWACRWLDLGPPPPAGTRADPAPLLKALGQPLVCLLARLRGGLRGQRCGAGPRTRGAAVARAGGCGAGQRRRAPDQAGGRLPAGPGRCGWRRRLAARRHPRGQPSLRSNPRGRRRRQSAPWLSSHFPTPTSLSATSPCSTVPACLSRPVNGWL